MTQLSENLIAPVLQALKQTVTSLDIVGTLDGLVSLHFDTHARLKILHRTSLIPSPSLWIAQNRERLTQAPQIALLGCLLAQHGDKSSIDQDIQDAFLKGISALQARREDFFTSTAWVLSPPVVAGIGLGIRAINDSGTQVWFTDLVKKGTTWPTVPLLPRLLYLEVLDLFGVRVDKISPASLFESIDKCSLPELALGIWLANREIGDWKNDVRLEWVQTAQQKLFERLISEPIYENQDYKAALLWLVATDCINQSIPITNSTDHVVSMLRNIPSALERWKPTWDVVDETDVQRIAYLVLRTYFDDLRFEENLPKLGRSGHRYDIGIPQLQLLIELKFARVKSDFQKFVTEVGQDVAQIHTQTMFTSFVVFIFDMTCSTENYGWTRNTLLEFAPVRECVIVCAPSTVRSTAK